MQFAKRRAEWIKSLLDKLYRSAEKFPDKFEMAAGGRCTGELGKVCKRGMREPSALLHDDVESISVANMLEELERSGRVRISVSLA